jgi:hypothetical protein
LNKYELKVSNLYEILSISLADVNTELNEKFLTTNTFCSNVYNHTNFNLGDDNKLLQVLEEFYQKTGYNICVDIINYETVYTKNILAFVLLICVSSFIVVISIIALFKQVKAVKYINKVDEKGYLGNYFEGEINFNDFLKRHPLNEKFKYNDSENDELRKKNKK